jgi:hypothetical protein
VAMMLLMATDAPSSFFQFGTTYTTSGGKQAIDYGDGEMMHVWPSPEDRVAPATIQCLQARLPMGMCVDSHCLRIRLSLGYSMSNRVLRRHVAMTTRRAVGKRADDEACNHMIMRGSHGNET